MICDWIINIYNYHIISSTGRSILNNTITINSARYTINKYSNISKVTNCNSIRIIYKNLIRSNFYTKTSRTGCYSICNCYSIWKISSNIRNCHTNNISSRSSRRIKYITITIKSTIGCNTSFCNCYINCSSICNCNIISHTIINNRII